MALQTSQVTCQLYDQNGNNVAGARITFTLASTDIASDGVVSPESYTAVADSNGLAVVDLFPNDVGLEGTAYIVKAVNPDTNKKFIVGTCIVPELDCNLHDILVLGEVPDIAAGTQIFLNARAQAVLAAASASAANVSAGTASTAATTATNAANSATASAATATTQAGIATTQAGIATTQAGIATAAAAVFPVGGTTAQFLRKNSATNYDASWYTLTKTDVGLTNVDNTSDANKPVSTAQQTALNLKANLAGPALTGTPTSTTAAVDTNTTQIATTAFVLGQSASATPLIDGVAAVGSSTRFARGDHVHPTDTSRAPLASPTLTGVPAAPTAAVDTNTTQLATTAFVIGQAGSSNPLMNAAVAAGSSTRFSRQDHVHPVDTSRAPLASPAFTGIVTGPVFREPRSAVTTNIDTSIAGVFTKTISGSTTFTVSNVAASGTVTAFMLDLTNGGSAAVTWWSGMKWAGGVAPTLTVSGRDLLGFVTHDGGTTWSGIVMGLDIK